MTRSAPDALRDLLARPGLITMPCCFDPLSAKLIEQAAFPLTFMSGFAASAARLGMPDTGLMSYGEVVDQGRNICNAVSIPVIGDGDTGYGNALNVKRTVAGFAQAGFAAVMIEDQVAPKRCGHTPGKAVVGAVLVAADGRPPEAGRILLRNLVKYLILLVPPLAVLALMDPNLQGLNDLVGQTVVVRRKENPGEGENNDR